MPVNAPATFGSQNEVDKRREGMEAALLLRGSPRASGEMVDKGRDFAGLTIPDNLRVNDGFYPGSGFQTVGDATTGAVRGRLDFGNRQGNLKFVARFDANSAEYAKLKAQATGTAVIALAHDANNSLQLTWQKVAFSTMEIGETDKFATVAVDCVPQYDATNGILTAVAKVAVDGICEKRKPWNRTP